MKGTPFYSGEYDKREGPASDRVNLWPLAYYRAPALSVLWPLGEFSDDRFAIRPLFSMYRDDKNAPWHEYNSLFGLFSVNTQYHSQMFFPLYYYRDRPEGDDIFLSLLYAQGPDWTALPPLLSCWDDDGRSGRLLLGLGGWDDNRSWAFPLYFQDSADDTFLSLLYAQGRGWTALPPLLSCWDDDGGSGRILLGLGGWDDNRSWAFPLFYQDNDEGAFLSLLYAQSHGWTAIPPLLSRWDDDGGSGRILLGLGGWDDKRSWAFPLFYRNAATDTLVTPLWASQGGRWSAIPPLLSWQSRDPGTGDTSLYLLGGLAGFEPDADWFAPIYFRNRESGDFFSLLYAQGRDWSAIPPLLSWWNDDGSGRALLGLGGWDDNRSWAFPLFFRDKSDGTFLSLLYAQSHGWTTIPPLLSAWNDKGDGIALLGLAGWGNEESWLLPLWYRNRFGLLTPIWGRMHDGDTIRTYWFTPLVGTREGRTTGSWFFPLWNTRRYSDGRYDDSFLFLGGRRGGGPPNRISSVWFFPLFSEEFNPKLAPLRAEMDAPRAASREFYHVVERSTRWDNTTRKREKEWVIAPVVDAATEKSHYLLGLGGAEHDVALGGFRWNFSRLPTTSKDSPLARFMNPGRAPHVQTPSQATAMPTNAVARYVSEDSSWFFPLWWHETMRGVMFDLPSGTKSLDARIETFSALLFLYDWRQESVPEEGHDYVRRRVLWRLYHYEKLNGDESTDIFPAITYDRRKDGYSKFSFLWRLFRYESDPKKGTSLDILFLPLMRP